jgi:hypothetical protein
VAEAEVAEAEAEVAEAVAEAEAEVAEAEVAEAEAEVAEAEGEEEVEGEEEGEEVEEEEEEEEEGEEVEEVEVAEEAEAGNADGTCRRAASGPAPAAGDVQRPKPSAVSRFAERGSELREAAAGDPRPWSSASRRRSSCGRSAHGASGRPFARARP